ncbi:hypothetical protein VPK21_004375 [Sinorhizobium kummerowiae]|uniref:hypothetical protein n=1 Tax=Sinorhizobium kummerowiae TaxID=158892 RepID=UPI002B4BAFE7|nr:hypothetical protein [Sinorhizobium kummerowiae]WRW46182.1 hypothetical protein VPK21_004375 [Sinorhizobium kummerowiae]
MHIVHCIRDASFSRGKETLSFFRAIGELCERRNRTAQFIEVIIRRIIAVPLGADALDVLIDIGQE